MDDAASFGHPDGGLAQVRPGEREAKNLSVRRIFSGEEIERGIVPELDLLHSVLEPRELAPLPGSGAEIMGKVAAISVGD